MVKRLVLIKCIQHAIQRNNSRHPNGSGYRHFSYVVSGNTIISAGSNMQSIDAVTRVSLGYKPHQGAHAELMAVTRARPDKLHKGFKLVNIHLNRANKLKCSRPCQACQALLRACFCRGVCYSTDTGFAYLDLGLSI